MTELSSLIEALHDTRKGIRENLLELLVRLLLARLRALFTTIVVR